MVWRYADKVTFVVVGDNAFCLTHLPLESWYYNFNLPMTDGLELTKFVVDSIEKADPELRALSSLSLLPCKAVRQGSQVHIAYVGEGDPRVRT